MCDRLGDAYRLIVRSRAVDRNGDELGRALAVTCDRLCKDHGNIEDGGVQRRVCRRIMAGDFNDTPFSHIYKLLTKGRIDSFLECGDGIGTTYVGALPGLRIDFILGDEEIIQFCSHRVLHTSYSDHNPVLVKCYAKR